MNCWLRRKIIAPLAEGLRALRKARAKLTSGNIEQSARNDADFMLARKESDFAEALRRAAGVELDALAEDETVAPGESLPISVRVFVPPNSPVKVGEVRLRVPAGWGMETTTEPEKPVRGPFRAARETAAKAANFKLSVPENAAPTQPYWLNEPRAGLVFKWPEGSPKGEPFNRPLVSGEATIEIDGVEMSIERPVEYRFADDIRGELRRALNVVPALSVALDTDLLIAPSAGLPSAQRIAVRVTNNSQHTLDGAVKLQLPDGWTAQPAAAPFRLNRKGERTAAIFKVTIPRATKAGAYRIAAAAEAGGRTFTQEMRTIAYPHISTHRMYVPAAVTVRVFDLKIAPVRVGYIMGSGDQVAEAIRRMNLDVTMLDENELSSGDLARFDTIVVGVRASQVRPDFVANNNRLLEFVKEGGTLIVQYQRPDYVAANLAPYPAKMASRTTDERAPVTILNRSIRLSTFPTRSRRKIGKAGCRSEASIISPPSIRSMCRCSNRTMRARNPSAAEKSTQRSGAANSSTLPTHGFASFPPACPARTGSSPISSACRNRTVATHLPGGRRGNNSDGLRSGDRRRRHFDRLPAGDLRGASGGTSRSARFQLS
jgi:hypothetical protein